MKQTEEDADKEILEIKTKYEKELKIERETLIKIRGELGISRKKTISCQKDMDSQKENLEWMNKEQSKMKGELKINEKDKFDLKREKLLILISAYLPSNIRSISLLKLCCKRNLKYK